MVLVLFPSQSILDAHLWCVYKLIYLLCSCHRSLIQQLMKQQDRGLDVLAQGVDRLGQMSTAFSEELGQQNKMLDVLETDLDEAAEELDMVTRKTKELIAKAGGTSNFCLIAALSIVVLVLILLLLYS